MRFTGHGRWSRWVFALVLGGAGCSEAEPRLVQTPESPGLSVREGDIVLRDVPAGADVGPVGADQGGEAETTADAPGAEDTGPGEDVGPGPEPDAGDGVTPPEPDAASDSGGGVACTSDSDCVTDAICASARCLAGRCEVAPALDGTPCDDGDACTRDDACTASRCRGLTPVQCDDGDACTLETCDPVEGCVASPRRCDDQSGCTVDSCLPEIGCVFTPVGCDDGDACTVDACVGDGSCDHTPIPGCGGSDPCGGLLGGDPCDDGDAETRGDMCIEGACRGYLVGRVSGRAVTTSNGYAYDGLVLTEVDHGPTGWSVVLWSAGSAFGNTTLAWSLGGLTMAGQMTIYRGSLAQPSRSWPRHYTGLSDGFVVEGGERLRFFDAAGSQWVPASNWNDALDAVDFGTLTTLVALQDTDANGARTTQRVWLGRLNNGDGGALLCTRTVDGRPRCSEQVLSTPRGNDSADVYPMAVAAIPRCQASGCSGAWMAMAADFEAGGNGAVRWNQEAYVNALGDGAAWSSSWSTSETSAIETSAVGAWGSVTAPRVVLVGSGGLLVHGVGSGGTMTWTRLTGVEGLASRNFTGVAVAGDTVLVSATRTSGSEVVYELWAMPTSGQGGLASTWKIHEILRASAVEAAGLYDVDGRSGGEVMAVGSVRRTDGSTWLDGLVLRRSGD